MKNPTADVGREAEAAKRKARLESRAILFFACEWAIRT
jgi:hypothetical protein